VGEGDFFLGAVMMKDTLLSGGRYWNRTNDL